MLVHWLFFSGISYYDDRERAVMFDYDTKVKEQYRSYGNVPALLMEKDLRCPSVHYFRHERELE
jgi:hypothetical protein